MKIKEIENLRKQENKKVLRLPNNMQGLSAREIDEMRVFFQYWANLTVGNEDLKLINFNSLIIKSLIRKLKGVKKFNGLGTKKHKYSIKSKYGDGKLMNARYVFKDNIYPGFIERGYCFANCFKMAYLIHVDDKKPCKVLSGIFGSGDHSVLHSVLELESGNILDFNIDVLCEKELYCQLFGFEVLEELESEKIVNFTETIENLSDFIYPKGWGYGYMVFAFDESVQYFEDYNNGNAEYIDPIGNF